VSQYDSKRLDTFIVTCCLLRVADRNRARDPNISQQETHGPVLALFNRSAIDDPALRKAPATERGYAISQRAPKRIEEVFGWMKTVGGLRKLRHRCGGRVNVLICAAPRCRYRFLSEGEQP
jgi:hypothetical protein